ncbi:MAG: hypothetical protein HY609_01190 [Deltaproteobacteria bacterium]|nr:hypothetical protein [Deltaproteobacteria bacterium]MBI4223524.1 hypothetical protein [Deltaproteobacteria bacterium]
MAKMLGESLKACRQIREKPENDASGKLKDLTETDLGDLFTKQGSPFLLIVGATWCKPCRELENQLTTLRNKWKGKVDVFKVDLDSEFYSGLVKQFLRENLPEGEWHLPVVILFKGGLQAARYSSEEQSAPEPMCASFFRFLQSSLCGNKSSPGP